MPRARPKTMQTKGSGEQLLTVERKPIRPLERQRMRPWLIDLLDQNTCHQLVWISKRLGTFRVSWKHVADQTFDPVADASLFELWARHTGKYFLGDLPDPKKWKANFRCALHSLQDVHEDKTLGVKKGNNAFRVYKFLDEKMAKKPTTKKVKVRKMDNEESENEFEVLQNIGTRSRPKKVQQGFLDSEGSETGQSPILDTHHSDWDMGDLRQQEYEVEKSPLTNFDELCQTGPILLPCSSQSCVLPVMQTSQTNQLTNSDFKCSDQVYDNEDFEDLAESKWMDDDLSCMSDFNEPFWASVIGNTLDVQEEVVISDVFLNDHQNGPNVIVLTQDRISNDVLEYTSIADVSP